MTEPSTDDASGTGPPYRRVFEAIGVVAGVAALLVLTVPSVARVVTRTVGPIVGSTPLVAFAGVVAGGYALVGLWRRGRKGGGPEPIVASPPERAQYGRQDVAGASIDESVDTVGGELPEARSADYFTLREKQDVKSRLTTVTVNVLASEYDVPRETAASMIADGSWTDRERAAALLGGERAATLSPRTQFVDWLSGNAYERRVEVTVAAIARHAGVATAADGSTSTAADGSASTAADGSASTAADGSASTGSRTATESALPVSERAVPASVANAIERVASAANDEDGEPANDSLALDDPAPDGSADDRSEGESRVDDDDSGGESSAVEREPERVADDGRPRARGGER